MRHLLEYSFAQGSSLPSPRAAGLRQRPMRLVALGLGWNFMFIGGTALLTESYRQSEQEKAQAANDFLVFATISVATFSSGALQNGFGWMAVNSAMVLPLTVALGAVLWLTAQQRRTAS